MLNLSGVNVDLAGNRILRDVSASFEPSKTIGIVGRNGAGKTTLLRTIMGLTRIKSGKIAFDGTDLTALPGHRRAALKVGYAPEDRVIFPTMTVEQNLHLPAKCKASPRPRSRRASPRC